MSPHDFARDFFLFLREHKAFWITPIVIALLFLLAMILFGESAPFSPFIYNP